MLSALHAVRKKGGRDTRSEAVFVAQAVVDDLLPPDESNTLERAVERHEGATALEALQKLPEPYREAIVLRYIDQLSPGEIADIVGESENAVSVRIHRGLKKLRAILEPDHE
ncbi:MAG: RNA polymerase, sigma-24 subunit, ECF subfamily [Candidatus Adlerbacteria bacterium GW2011_GWC1_50_9]|uniref:RNA polymerase, sigma-24 subunit, ECF subfamily n=1 Tax=Candidatus Adlerbacteria bacterium GW2011_GWC1_50_9 TaxID=1618608 RepID=A0A0G1WKE8_9BACT|nr:MAG: RNA polymerase, sigma-24 subunit, ECF subfamily [Candidatus Adlerbacteria bacterium GW2011_GWC1_50_9]